MPQKTTIIDSKYAQQRRLWRVIDAKDAVLGRVASTAAGFLRGKNKRHFSPSVDCGDFVVVTNAGKIRVTGEKESTKTYFRHSGYAAGAKVIGFKHQMMKDPRVVVELAVKGMLPKTRLRRHQLRRLKIYSGESHPHSAQKVEVVRV